MRVDLTQEPQAPGLMSLFFMMTSVRQSALSKLGGVLDAPG